MTPAKQKAPPERKNITTIDGDVVDSVITTGDNNTVTVNKTTIIQKFFNIFKSDSETLEQRNRRILLGHVENAWIKGVLDASLHGAALLDLGIKEDPEAVTKYPWAIKKEATDETLPAGTSMLEIFESIGMGRSLLILGAPGSGKTTMLLELARGLIARAREDITQSIPMVFNLSSWTESKTIADWLAQELNNLYSVPRKTAPDWVKGNKLLLLLDGLDEVRQDSRAKCVEAINEFRKQNGLTSLAVCSRSQEYADLNAKLSFEGAIEVQPLTRGQITEFFTRFGDEMAGIKQALEKDDSVLREMAETPLFLSIMLMTYRDKRDVDIWVSQDEKAQRKHLFDTYIERMFERPRSKNMSFNKQSVLNWISWLARKMVDHSQVVFIQVQMQRSWLGTRPLRNKHYKSVRIISAIIGGLLGLLIGSFALVLLNIFSPNTLSANAAILILLLCLLAGFGYLLGYSESFSFGLDIYENTELLDKFKSELPTQELEFLAGKWKEKPLPDRARSLESKVHTTVYVYSLKFLLFRNGFIPENYSRFLDHCVDLIFLRRVGGGYIFVHRLLMEHFAEMYVETTK